MCEFLIGRDSRRRLNWKAAGLQIMYVSEYELLVGACGEGWISQLSSLGEVCEQGGEGGVLVEHSYIYTREER